MKRCEQEWVRLELYVGRCHECFKPCNVRCKCGRCGRTVCVWCWDGHEDRRGNMGIRFTFTANLAPETRDYMISLMPREE